MQRCSHCSVQHPPPSLHPSSCLSLRNSWGADTPQPEQGFTRLSGLFLCVCVCVCVCVCLCLFVCLFVCLFRDGAPALQPGLQCNGVISPHLTSPHCGLLGSGDPPSVPGLKTAFRERSRGSFAEDRQDFWSLERVRDWVSKRNIPIFMLGCNL